MSDVLRGPVDPVDDGAVRRLPCGADVETLLEQVADGTAPDAVTADHQRGCRFCRTALADLAAVWSPVDELNDTLERAPRTLDASVMERVATHATHGWHAVVTDHPGVTRIAAWVVAVVARRAAAGVPGVHDVAGQVAPDETAVSEVRASFVPRGPGDPPVPGPLGLGVSGRTVVVTLTVSIGAGVPIPAVVDQVRAAVTRHVRLLTGLSAVRVDVHVADLA